MNFLKLTPISIAKRFAEFALKNYYTGLILKAYQNDSKSLEIIARAARTFYGLNNRRKSVFNVWDIDFIHQAQIDLYRSKKSAGYQGVTSIGFGDLRIEWSSDDANSSEVHLYGFSDNFPWFEVYKKFVRPGTTALDVGANIGIHTLVLSACAGDKGAVIAFEPSAAIYKRLLGTILLNGLKNVTALPCGAGEKASRRKFEPRSANFNIGQGKIDDNGSAEITITTIDDQLEKQTMPVSLIKIDTEGYELNVLKGAQETLRKHRPAIVAEFNAASYSFDQFAKEIPFEADFYRIPHSKSDEIEPFYGTLTGCFDVLIVPRR